MIAFRCWYCGKRYVVAETRIGEQLSCSCKNTLRIPKTNNGYCRIKKPVDYVVESLVYGGGGALLALGLFLLVVVRLPFTSRVAGGNRWAIAGVMMAVGFLLGTFGGERGVNWIGRKIREKEQG